MSRYCEVERLIDTRERERQHTATNMQAHSLILIQCDRVMAEWAHFAFIHTGPDARQARLEAKRARVLVCAYNRRRDDCAHIPYSPQNNAGRRRREAQCPSGWEMTLWLVTLCDSDGTSLPTAVDVSAVCLMSRTGRVSGEMRMSGVYGEQRTAAHSSQPSLMSTRTVAAPDEKTVSHEVSAKNNRFSVYTRAEQEREGADRPRVRG